MITDSDGCAADAAGGDADEGRWAERLAEASSDYEAIDAETLAGLGCDRW